MPRIYIEVIIVPDMIIARGMDRVGFFISPAIVEPSSSPAKANVIVAKKEKVEKYLLESKDLGTLEE